MVTDTCCSVDHSSLTQQCKVSAIMHLTMTTLHTVSTRSKGLLFLICSALIMGWTGLNEDAFWRGLREGRSGDSLTHPPLTHLWVHRESVGLIDRTDFKVFCTMVEEGKIKAPWVEVKLYRYLHPAFISQDSRIQGRGQITCRLFLHTCFVL